MARAPKVQAAVKQHNRMASGWKKVQVQVAGTRASGKLKVPMGRRSGPWIFFHKVQVWKQQKPMKNIEKQLD